MGVYQGREGVIFQCANNRNVLRPTGYYIWDSKSLMESRDMFFHSRGNAQKNWRASSAPDVGWTVLDECQKKELSGY